MGQNRTHAVQQDRTFIGRIERGFDFLGYHFSRQGLGVAKQTICELHRESISAL
jgi:hypothetical protein